MNKQAVSISALILGLALFITALLSIVLAMDSLHRAFDYIFSNAQRRAKLDAIEKKIVVLFILTGLIALAFFIVSIIQIKVSDKKVAGILNLISVFINILLVFGIIFTLIEIINNSKEAKQNSKNKEVIEQTKIDENIAEK